MLRVLFGRETENTIRTPNIYFNNVYEDDWFDDEIVKQIVNDIDNSVLRGLCVLSPVLGSISVQDLSGGCKTLILLYKLDDFEPNLIWLGNNCEDWLIKISNIKDINVVMTGKDLHFKGKTLNGICLNDNGIISNGIDWCKKCLDYTA